jgi:hypothetical protein
VYTTWLSIKVQWEHDNIIMRSFPPIHEFSLSKFPTVNMV